MKLADLLRVLPPMGIEGPAFPGRLLGAFRRKSITFCTGVTDEKTVVYWFQSRTFTIDLRLPDAAATPVLARQGWVGDTLWGSDSQELSWSVATGYQLHNQWPEPARFHHIGNSVLEFAPSGAYVEDWRQQCSTGPLLGLRLLGMIDRKTGEELPMDGGLILAGEHLAYAQSRSPSVHQALRNAADLDRALAEGLVTSREIESYEVSVAMGGRIVSHSTQVQKVGEEIAVGDFELQPDGFVVMSRIVDGDLRSLRFAVDLHLPEFAFERQTSGTPDALRWMEAEKGHLARHTAIAL